MDIKEIYEKKESLIGKEIEVSGWIRNHRKQKEFGFIDFSDGTCFKHLQVVYDNTNDNFLDIQKYHIGSAIKVKGILVKSEGKEQDIEVKAKDVVLLGDCDEDYPMQPKRHTMEFLREQAYLRPRTNIFQAVFRIRSVAASSIHSYFQDRNYVYFNAPLITASDCEGAGEMFKVTTLDLEKIKDGKIDYSKDFFGKPTSLTVSGQLQAETWMSAFKKVYTFGPTFRAENSNTKTHANEFWMIEPEIAFCDLEQNMDIMEDMLKYIVKTVLEKCSDEIEFLNKFVDKTLKEKLTKLVNSKFTRITHEEVITILKNSKVDFEFTPEYGEDIAKEHEKFYMKQNEDGKTVAAVDLEVPGAGELMGGSQREENYEKLLNRMKELNMNTKELEWYLNLRRYGTCIHSGFGMGFERLLIYLTGVENIRDVIPYPRTPGNCEF